MWRGMQLLPRAGQSIPAHGPQAALFAACAARGRCLQREQAGGRPVQWTPRGGARYQARIGRAYTCNACRLPKREPMGWEEKRADGEKRARIGQNCRWLLASAQPQLCKSTRMTKNKKIKTALFKSNHYIRTILSKASKRVQHRDDPSVVKHHSRQPSQS